MLESVLVGKGNKIDKEYVLWSRSAPLVCTSLQSKRYQLNKVSGTRSYEIVCVKCCRQKELNRFLTCLLIIFPVKSKIGCWVEFGLGYYCKIGEILFKPYFLVHRATMIKKKKEKIIVLRTQGTSIDCRENKKCFVIFCMSSKITLGCWALNIVMIMKEWPNT